MKQLPKIDFWYWALIISATTLGETGGDLVSQSVGLGYGGGSVVLVGLFVVALAAQLWTKVTHPALYWAVIVLASTAGTTLSDFTTRSLGLGYATGTLIMVTLLAMVFSTWRFISRAASTSGALSVTTESLYWAAILISSTLGTALGDYLADDVGLGLGFEGGSLFLAGLLLLVILLERFTKLSKEICYWLAIVITHPIGATNGDFLTKPVGMNLGNVQASLLLLVVFIVVIGVIRWKNRTTALAPAGT